MGILDQLRRSLTARSDVTEVARLSKEVETLRRQNDDLRQQVARALGPRVRDLTAPVPSMSDVRHVDLGTGVDAFAIGIVGESYRQVALRELAGERRKRGEEVAFTAVLVPESDNPKDPNAVAVHINGGAQVGYLSADDAVVYKIVFDALTTAGRIGACRAKLIGGTKGKPSIGVVLDLEDPRTLLQRIAGESQPF